MTAVQINQVDQKEAAALLEPPETITAEELARASGLSAEDLYELVEYGALIPMAILAPQAGPEPNAYRFSADCITALRSACHVQRDFDLDLFTTGVLMGYLNRIDTLEREVQLLHANRPSYASVKPNDSV